MAHEGKRPNEPYEVDGFLILKSEIIDADNKIIFSFVIQGDKVPDPDTLRFRVIMEKIGRDEVLKNKGWMDEEGNAKLPLELKRECTMIAIDKFRLEITLTKGGWDIVN